MAKMMMMMIMFGSFVDVANVGNNIGNGSAGVNHPPSSCSSSSSPSSLVSLAPSSSLSLHRSHHYSTGLVSCEVDSTSTNMHAFFFPPLLLGSQNCILVLYTLIHYAW